VLLLFTLWPDHDSILFLLQFVPQYNTYTCYKDVDQDSEGNSGAQAPSGQYRHATYVIRDPFQEQQIAQSRSRAGQVRLSHCVFVACRQLERCSLPCSVLGSIAMCIAITVESLLGHAWCCIAHVAHEHHRSCRMDNSSTMGQAAAVSRRARGLI
jgi:hypothetical protein